MAFQGFGAIVGDVTSLLPANNRILNIAKNFSLLGQGIKVLGKNLNEMPRGKELRAMGEGIGKIFGKLGSIGKLPGISGIVQLFDKIMSMSVSGGLTAFFEAFERLGDILGVIFGILSPFLDLLSIIASVLEAALAPLIGYIYEKLQPVFQELIEAIPELTESMIELIAGDNKLGDAIINLIKIIPSLISGLIEILPMIMTLAIVFATEIIPSLIQLLPLLIRMGIAFAVDLFKALPELLPQLFTLAESFLELFRIFAQLAPIIGFLIGILGPFLGTILGAMFGFMIGGPWGAIAGMAVGAAIDISRGIVSAQEGVMFTQPTLALVNVDNPPEVLAPVDKLDSMGGGITVSVMGNVYDARFVDNIINELQRRKDLGIL